MLQSNKKPGFSGVLSIVAFSALSIAVAAVMLVSVGGVA